MTSLFSEIELLQINHDEASQVSIRAIDLLGQLASQSGAKVFVLNSFPNDEFSFHGREKEPVSKHVDPKEWAQAQPNRILLIANVPDGFNNLLTIDSIPAVEVNIEAWQSESTLYAQSGMAKLFGHPDKEPTIPAGNYSSGTIAYAAFTALTAVYSKLKRFGKLDVARVNGLEALAWVNWKSIAAAQMGEILNREGKAAEWPALPCKDGYAAFVFVEFIWKAIVKMIGDERLSSEKFSSYEGRKANRGEYMDIIRSWALTKTKDELKKLFFDFNIPGAPVVTLSDLLVDPLFLYRKSFRDVKAKDDKLVKSPIPPHRIVSSKKSRIENVYNAAFNTASGSELPLSGVRILDFGLITAGAGSSAVLSDLGAEVLKIESTTYADPFRRWMGTTDSPLFKYNNRNKYGICIDMKTAEGKAQFINLLKDADVVLENFRRGVLDRMGFSFEELKKHNPNIVLASISGQGLDGPMTSGMTFGSTLEANAGMAALTRDAEGIPFVSGRNLNYPDQTVCLYAGAAIALAVIKSKAENCAINIDISQRDVAMYLLGDAIEFVSGGGEDSMKSIKNTLNTFEIDDLFQSVDNRWVSVSISSLSHLQKIPELEQAKSVSDLEQWCHTKTTTEIENELRSVSCGAATVANGEEVYENIKEQVAFAKTPNGILVKGFPFQLRDTPMSIWGESPELGEHTQKFIS